MSRRFSSELLRRIRNEIPIDQLIADVELPTKRREGYSRFLCPLCSDFHTATNPKTNLARCFRCERNFNTIDLIMIMERKDFVASVKSLKAILAVRELKERLRRLRS